MAESTAKAPFITMYVHQHWGYRHPYSARTWTVADWRGYAQGLATLGYTGIMIWPMLEIIPDPLTPSDRAHLEKMRAVIDLLHQEFGMQVFITMGANVIGNAEAANYTFEERPYFRCDRRLNPADPAAMATLHRLRRQFIGEYLRAADGFVMIDSDPGGYPGSTNREFVEMMRAQLAIINGYNPEAWLYYWMWLGWETYNRFWVDVQAGKTRYNWSTIGPDCTAAVRLLLEYPEERWRLLCCMNDVHKPLVRNLGLQARTAYNPYGLIEGEPTFPMTNWTPDKIFKGLQEYDRELTPLGVFANAQNHVLQLPNTYAFAHFASGGTPATLDLPGFAEKLFPGHGALLAEVWSAMGGTATARMRELSAALAKVKVTQPAGGPFAGLLFGAPAQYLTDLVLQLKFRADLLDFVATEPTTESGKMALRALVKSWRVWQQQTGFADAYFGPMVDLLHPVLRKLNDPAVDKVLFENDDFRVAELRHGVVLRLLAALEKI